MESIDLPLLTKKTCAKIVPLFKRVYYVKLVGMYGEAEREKDRREKDRREKDLGEGQRKEITSDGGKEIVFSILLLSSQL